MIIACKSCHTTFRLDSRLIKSTGSQVKCSKCQMVFTVYLTNGVERRKHQRVKTQNLISHFAFDETGKLASEGLGRAVDISKGGMLLETPYPIETGNLSLMAVDLENNLFEIKGKLVYTKKTSTGMYLSGIEFVGNNRQVANFIIKLVKEYKYQKSNLYIRWNKQKPLPIISKSQRQSV